MAAVRNLDEAVLTARVIDVYERVLTRAERGRRTPSLTDGGG